MLAATPGSQSGKPEWLQPIWEANPGNQLGGNQNYHVEPNEQALVGEPGKFWFGDSGGSGLCF